MRARHWLTHGPNTVGSTRVGTDADQFVAERLIQANVAGQRITYFDVDCLASKRRRHVFEEAHHDRGYPAASVPWQDRHAADVEPVGHGSESGRADRCMPIKG